MGEGWVYVLVNSSIPGLAKVGRTQHAPKQRAAELSAVTGVPTPFIVAFEQAFDDCAEAEKIIHAELSRRGLRITPNREFFSGPTSDIIRVVLETAGQREAVPSQEVAISQAARKLVVDPPWSGPEQEVQNTTDAQRCYRLAAARGSLVAMEQLGRLYAQLYTAHPSRTGRHRVLAVLKEGARLGNYYCYVELARFFAAERQLGNFTKAWDMFFAARARRFHDDIEDFPNRLACAYGCYISTHLLLNQRPARLSALRLEADAILKILLVELDQPGAGAAERGLLTQALHWCYENLFTPPTNLRSAPIKITKSIWTAIPSYVHA